MERIRHLAAQLPALGAFLDGLEPVFLGWPAFRDRVCDGFLAVEPEILRRSLARLEAAGVQVPVDSHSVSQIAALWDSDFFRLFLHAVGFYPPPDADPGAELLPPVSNVDEASERDSSLQALYGQTDYWKINLRRTYPEVFLEPALAGRQGLLAGCDLACGWGRGTLSLRDFGSRRMHCCDQSAANLNTLRRFVARRGASATAHRCEISRLPLADDSLDFSLTLDVFELLADESLEKVLRELLRCHKPGATIYAKVTLYARAPVLGQVQYFTRDYALALFTGVTWRRKRLRVQLADARLPEHFAFEVVEG